MTDGELGELRYLSQRDAHGRLARCIGKDRFESRGVALLAVSRNLKAVGAHPYRCPFCGHWHVGTALGRIGKGSNHDRKDAGHGGHG